jgi:hypothetical protein
MNSQARFRRRAPPQAELMTKPADYHARAAADEGGGRIVIFIIAPS